MIAVVTGGRDQFLTFRSEFRRSLVQLGVTELRHGGCRGVDLDAAEVARGFVERLVEYPADWERDGRAAGPIRNGKMLDGADVLFAWPGGRGTADCIRQAERLGVRVVPMEEHGAALARLEDRL